MDKTESIGPWIKQKRKLVYDNPWIEVRHDEVVDPNGNPGIYGSVHFKNFAIGIIPLDGDMNTWIVGQHRYPLDEYSWEIPMGGGNINADIIDSARRELKEETGIVASKLTLFLKIHMSNCVCDETGYAFVAEDLKMGPTNHDPSEKLVLRKLPFVELVDMVMDGAITDSLSVAAVLKFAKIKEFG